MPPQTITQAVTALDEVDGIELLEDPSQYTDSARWVIKVKLSPSDIEASADVPPETDWYVCMPEIYPVGSIDIYPAFQSDNTITATFPHQLLNVAGDDDVPWRTGKICVARYGHVLDQAGATDEPTVARDRLRWHLERALNWLVKASRNELREPDDPFEIPAFNTRTGLRRTIAFNETTESLEIWATAYGQSGIVDLSQLPTSAEVYATHEFRNSSGEVLFRPNWGDFVETDMDDQFPGAWVLLEELPFRLPWEPPETWRDLNDLLAGTVVDPYELRAKIKPILEDLPVKILLVGFPIPEVVDGDPVTVHWQPIEIDKFSDPSDINHRATKIGQQRAERFAKGDEEIRWLEANNWSHDQLARRGNMSDWLLDRNILLIGAGALGSVVAECLVRDGCRYITVIDDEGFEIGNLARHTLSLNDVGRNKATALADRLQALSPHVQSIGIDTAFPPSGDVMETINEAEVVIDCTGAREVRYRLNDFHWDHPVLFCSAAMGRRANRLFCFTAYSHHFPYWTYDRAFDLWRLQEQVEWDEDEDAVPERVGCWHPASVIQMSRVTRWAGTVTQLLNREVGLSLGETHFSVLENADETDLPTVTQATSPLKDVQEWRLPTSDATVQVPAIVVEAMYERCTDDDPDETGGILAGTNRGDSTALITNATDPPRDSIQEPTRFLRGTSEVDKWLKNVRDRAGIEYLGEWHYHPSASPEISDEDCQSMKEIATDDDYDCPHPLLFIVGQDETDQYVISVYLFHRDREHESLQRVETAKADNGDAYD